MDLGMSSGRHFVLVVDGDCHRGRATVQELRDSGCYAAAASTGADALTYALENEPDAVVVDWSLPDMSGLEFARRVKSVRYETRLFLRKDAPDFRSLRQTMESGGEDLLSRPSPIAVLIRALTASPAPAGAR